MGWSDWVAAARRGEGPLAFVRPLWRRALAVRMPVIRPLAALLWAERDLRGRLWPLLAKIFYREPLLRYRAESLGRRLHLEGSLPLIIGQGRIRIGDDVVIGARNTWNVGFKVSTDAQLVIGNRVYIGYQNFLSVAGYVEIGDDTMLVANVQILDNTSHPISPARRLRHESFSLAETAPVVIGNNCWIGTGAMILRGVTIGANSVVAAASVVTADVAPDSLVAGNPARLIRSIRDEP